MFWIVAKQIKQAAILSAARIRVSREIDFGWMPVFLAN